MYNRLGPLVSLIVPIYNVEKYLEECIRSLCGQKYQNIEVLLMDDGSTDKSPVICRRWCEEDKRLSLYEKQNSGYGDTVNKGIGLAQGKYLMIIESDDFTEPEMVEELVLLAEQHGADFIKSDYYRYWHGIKEQDYNFSQCICRRVFSANENMMKFTTDATVWSAIYRKDFLVKNKIYFLPTPGASYQDIGFTFKVFAAAEKGYFTPKAFVNYRQDNENASARSGKKVMAVTEELHSCEEFLKERKADACFYPWLMRSRFNVYRWNLSRIAPQFVDDFMEVFSDEIKQDVEAGRYHKEEYSEDEQSYIQKLINAPGSLSREKKEEKIKDKHEKLYQSLVWENLKDSRVTYIYGAGKIGCRVYGYLKHRFPRNIFRFVCTEGVKEKGVYGIDEIVGNGDLIIIAIGAIDEKIKVLERLEEKGFTKVLVWDNVFESMIKR